MVISATWTNGDVTEIPVSDMTFEGFDTSDRGGVTVTVKYGAIKATYYITVLAEETEITVTFTLLGDDVHKEGESEVHTLAAENLDTWVETKFYTMTNNNTVLDLLEQVLTENGMTWSNTDGNYISDITRNGVTLGEFTNGQNSGWMYTINNVHSELGVAEQYLDDGDVIVFHYTDDYTQESPIGGEKTVEDLEALVNALPEISNLTLENAALVAESSDVYNSLSESEKEKVRAEVKEKLDSAVLRIAALRKTEITGITEPYTTTGQYLSALADEYTIQVGSTGGEWMTIGLARAGILTDAQKEAYYANVVAYVNENINDNEQLHRAKSTDNSRVILCLTAIGKDVTNVDGHNLLAGLSDLNYLKTQGINGPIWALIALDSHDYEIPTVYEGGEQATRENIIETILSYQLEDGGWALSGNTSDVDMTGMAIQALAPYYDTNEEVKAAVDRALTYLSKVQNADGGYFSWGTTNSESIAQVIVALTALGIDPTSDSRFVKNGFTTIDALLTYYVEGGGFRHVADGELNGMATEQAYYSLVSYVRLLNEQPSLYDMSDVTIESVEEPDDPVVDPDDPVVDPDDPVVDPDEPDTPQDPGDTDNGSGDGTASGDDNGAASGDSSSPGVGDYSNMIFWICLAAAALAGGATVTVRRRKNR